MIIWSDLAVKVTVVQSKCETTRLVIDPNDILWVSGLERIQNGDNSFFKSCTIILLKILKRRKSYCYGVLQRKRENWLTCNIIRIARRIPNPYNDLWFFVHLPWNRYSCGFCWISRNRPDRFLIIGGIDLSIRGFSSTPDGRSTHIMSVVSDFLVLLNRVKFRLDL